jgi:hypothetical protein
MKRILLCASITLMISGCSSTLREAGSEWLLVNFLGNMEVRRVEHEFHGRSVVFSNVGLLFYPKSIRDAFIPLAITTSKIGEWPVDSRIIQSQEFSAKIVFDKFWVAAITMKDGTKYDILIESNAFTSVRPRDEAALLRYIDLIKGHGPYIATPILPR